MLSVPPRTTRTVPRCPATAVFRSVTAAEAHGGRPRHRQRDGPIHLAVGRVAHDAPAVPVRHPQAAVAVDRHAVGEDVGLGDLNEERSEEHTSELQSLMRNSYAVFSLN